MADTEDYKSIEQNKIGSKARHNLVIFLISLFLASLFWFFQSLDRHYITEIFIRANYINAPEDVISRYPFPDGFVLKIDASGWDIFELRRNWKNKPVEIDLSKFCRHKVLKVSSNRNLILPDEFSGIKVISITPDTLNLNFDPVVTKVLKVKARYHLSFKKYHGLGGKILVIPEFVEVTGPAAILKNINYAYTEKLYQKDLSQTTFKSVNLDLPANCTVPKFQQKVKINIPVEHLTEGKLWVFVEVPEDYKDSIHLIPDRVLLTFQAALSIFNDISVNDFKVFVSEDEFRNKNVDKLKIQYIVFNNLVYKTRIDPEFADFIITR